MHSACSPEGPLCFTCKPSPHTQHTGKFQSHCKTRSTAESTLHRNPITLSLCRLKRESSRHWLSLISTCQHRGWAAQGGPASPETCLHPSEMCGAAPQGMGRGGGGGWEAAVLTLALVLWLSAEWLRHVPTLLLAPLSFYCWIWSVSWSSLGATQGLELASALIENMQGDFGRARAGPQQGFLPDDVLISGVLDRFSHWWAWPLSLTPTLAAMVC